MAGKKVGIHGTDAETGRAKGEKKKCPVDSKSFMKDAKPAVASIPDLGITGILQPKEFSSGSLGLFTNGKCVVTVGGTPCEATYQMQVILNGSKPAE